MAGTVNPLALAGSRPDIMRSIRTAATETGADFDFLVKTAQRESNFNPEAKASTSSATGLFQFTDSTWLRMVDRYGAKHGLSLQAEAITVSGRKIETSGPVSRTDILKLRNDPDLSSRMAAELAQENSNLLEAGIGREPTAGELYLAHFMGPRDAIELINSASSGKRETAADLFPAAAQANHNIFYRRDGEPVSTSDLYARLTAEKVVPVVDAPNPVVGLAQSPLATAPVPTNYVRPVFNVTSGAAQLASGLLTALFDIQSEALSMEERSSNSEDRA